MTPKEKLRLTKIYKKVEGNGEEGTESWIVGKMKRKNNKRYMSFYMPNRKGLRDQQ